MASSYRRPAATSPEAPAHVVVPKVEAEAAKTTMAKNPIPTSVPPSPETEATTEALTREEVLRRRRRRAVRLFGMYRRLYWAMAEDVRARHRQYVWQLGHSPLSAEQPPSEAKQYGPAAAPPRRKKCGVTGCKARAMAMAKYCHYHILSDPTQTLYKSCGHIMIKNGAQITHCSRPILKASSPSLCNFHLQSAHKNIAQAYKKVGLINNPPAGGQVSPDFSALVAQCVRQIQATRRQS